MKLTRKDFFKTLIGLAAGSVGAKALTKPDPAIVIIQPDDFPLKQLITSNRPPLLHESPPCTVCTTSTEIDVDTRLLMPGDLFTVSDCSRKTGLPRKEVLQVIRGRQGRLRARVFHRHD